MTSSRILNNPDALRRSFSFIACCLPWLFLLAWLTHEAWFLCDDAFISFRYVRNLLEGHGLVFNPGERVEGYSNFLWVLELSALWGIFGWRPEHAAPWLSVACTAGTIAAVVWWIARVPGLQHRGLTTWIALGLLCSSATFAAWTSAGGLETRQFTLFVVLAIAFLTVRCNEGPGPLAAASFSLAAASYTRPEGPLVAVCCVAWFILQRLAARRNPRLNPGELVWLFAPFVVLVAAHFVFRYSYYGEWLPNTYYAKHIRPWHESGFRYLWAATLETGLYLLIPLALFALREAWRKHRDLRHALPLFCIALHAAYIFRIGGDHFEYRPLDFYWPLLAVPTSDGIVRLGSRMSGLLRDLLPAGAPLRKAARPWSCAVFVFSPVVFYASALQGVILLKGEPARAEWLMAAPGMKGLAGTASDLHDRMEQQWVAGRVSGHREFADMRIRLWADYERMDRDIIPPDAVTTQFAIGISSFYLPDLQVIDVLGLTDATIARHPVTLANEQRRIGHDRSPPPGYLEERGVNFQVYPPTRRPIEAVRRAEYAVLVDLELWMPFDSTDHDWVVARFGKRNLVHRKDFERD